MVATVAGSLLMAGVLTASADITPNIPYKVTAWTGNVYLPPTVHYTAYQTTKKYVPQVTIKQDDWALPLHQTKVSRAGRPGLLLDVYLYKYTNSHVDQVRRVASKIVKPEPRVVRVGRYVPPPPPPAPTPVPAPPVNNPVPVSGPGYTNPTPSPQPVYQGGDPRSIARGLVDPSQFGCLDLLWTHESGWNTFAENASSGAYGIPQSLPGSKMASAGSDWQTNPATQIRWGLGYIAGVYGTPCGAWAHEQAVNWY